MPLIAAFVCFYVVSQLRSPVAGFILFVVALGLVFDAGSALFARMTSTGGMRGHRQ